MTNEDHDNTVREIIRQIGSAPLREIAAIMAVNDDHESCGGLVDGARVCARRALHRLHRRRIVVSRPYPKWSLR